MFPNDPDVLEPWRDALDVTGERGQPSCARGAAKKLKAAYFVGSIGTEIDHPSRRVDEEIFGMGLTTLTSRASFV